MNNCAAATLYGMKKLKYILKYTNGFTLVETIITVFIFVIIVTVVIGSFVYALNLQRRGFNIQQVEENANFIFESMTKEIRVSTINTADINCPISFPSACISINHPIDGTVVYSISGTNLLKTINGLQTTLNSNTIQFASLNFYISGTINPDQKQPRVTILATIKSTNTNQQATINIETTVSQRSLQE